MISVKFTNRFKKIVRNARREDEVITVLYLVKEGFGKPHVHTGVGYSESGQTSL